MNQHILVVDDDEDTLKLVSLVLERQGYKVTAVDGGEKAISAVVSLRPDLVMLDSMMPEVSGMTVLRSLRSSPDTADIPVLMFTARNSIDARVESYEAGVDDYMTKPVHPAELVARVQALLPPPIQLVFVGPPGARAVVEDGLSDALAGITTASVDISEEGYGQHVAQAEYLVLCASIEREDLAAINRELKEWLALGIPRDRIGALLLDPKLPGVRVNLAVIRQGLALEYVDVLDSTAPDFPGYAAALRERLGLS